MTTTAATSVVLHGHFYQPPREDPWLEELEREPSAAPFHDWNERIEQECYRAVVAARRYAVDGRIAAIVNTLASISFDFGPTLLEWLERQAPATYEAILAADRESVERHGGHGNAIAMPYHHLILPLASRRDKVTEVRWGIADFRRRFHREPEGMWLPETAVDDETLDVLAAEGIRFTVLAPYQMEPSPPDGLARKYRTASGRDIALFAYDGAISHDIAFGGLLHDARSWSERMLATDASGSRRPLVAVATDGETYGHHHRFGEAALAWLLHDLGIRSDVRVENFAAALARHPARDDVMLVAPSSWSCAHGVERWRSDCACRTRGDSTRPSHWRAPLRQALDWLAGELHAVYEREGEALFGDPWQVRDGYAAYRRDVGAGARFVVEQLRHRDDVGERVRAHELLELEWAALAMFTSCGWFFDDISGIESLQVLRYAARAIDLAGREAPQLEAGLVERLAQAESAVAGAGTGRDLYLASVKPQLPMAARVAAGSVAARQLAPSVEVEGGAAHRVREGENGRVAVIHARTGREVAYRVAYRRRGAAHIELEVSSVENGNSLARLELDDLPERYRRPIVAALRAEVIERHCTGEERRQLAAGVADGPGIASRALVRAVRSLGQDASPGAVDAVLDLADLLALYGLHIPFDAQTAFHRIRAAASPGLAASLAPVASRLGFAAEA